MCVECDETETTEHILTDCISSGQETIWKLTQDLLTRADMVLPEITYSSILDCNLFQFLDSEGKTDKAARHHFTILMSEAAHLIWKVRCDWKIK